MSGMNELAIFGEDSLEHAFIEEFKARGYEHVKGETIQRDRREVTLFNDLQTYLRRKFKTGVIA